MQLAGESTARSAQVRWVMLGTALLAQITIANVGQGVPTLAPFIQADLGLSRGEVGLLGSALMAGMVVALTATGWAVDIFGERVVLIGGTLWVGLFCFVATATSQLTTALMVFFVVGVGTAFPTPAGSRMVMLWFPAAQRGLAMGIRQTGVPLGGALAAAVLPAVALVGGWRLAVVVGGVACLIAALICWSLYRRPAGAVEVRQAAERSSAGGLAAIMPRNVLLLGLAGAVWAAGQFCLLTYLALFLKETQGISVTTSAALLVGAQLVGAVGQVAWGSWSDRVFGGRRRATLLGGILLSGACALAMGWLPVGVPVWSVGLLVLAFAFGAFGWHGNWLALVAELARPEHQGRTIGIAMSMPYAGIVVGPPIFGSFVDRTGEWGAAWTLLALTLVAGAVIISRVREG